MVIHLHRHSRCRAGIQASSGVICALLSLLLLGAGGVRAEPSHPSVKVSIRDIQLTDAPSGDSPYREQMVTVAGSVTALFQDGFTIAESPGPWGAVYVYTKRCAPRLGEGIELSGQVIEHYGMTQITDVSSCYPVRLERPVSAIVVPLSQVASEAYESALVTIEDITVSALAEYGEWAVSDGVSNVRVDDKNDYMYFPHIGDALQSLTGILFYSFGHYKIEPRSTADLVSDVIPHYTLRGNVVTLNDNRDVLADTYVEVWGDRIIALSDTPPQGLPIVAVEGLIFPGLIDAHNHPFFNVLGRLSFGRTFANRYQWQAHPLYWDFRAQYAALRDYGGEGAQAVNMFRIAELRALSAGTTTIQGFNCNGHENDAIARQGIGINNAERFPSRVFDSPFPLSQNETFWQERASESWERFLIHLAEGTDAAALDEFYAWRGMDMLDERTAIIHGIPLGPQEWALMATAGAHLIWSPMSNWSLYGTTAKVPEALAAGVNVALASDWLASGSAHLLAELKFADYWDNSHWGDAISPQQLVEFVTRNAALALGIEERAGQISPGYRADLMVVRGDLRKPYSALLRATPADVLLTIVNGRPLAGDADLMAQFAFLERHEEIVICGRPKDFAVQIDSHAVPEANRSIAETLRAVRRAYDSARPQVSAFVGLEDTSPPLLTVEEPRCAAMPQGGRLGNRIKVLAFDDCQVQDVDITDVQLFDRYGKAVANPYEIVGQQLYVECGSSTHTVRIVASARDVSGNVAYATLSARIGACGSYLPLLLTGVEAGSASPLGP